MDYADPLFHGECVSIGLLTELYCSFCAGNLKEYGDIERVRRILELYKLPTKIPQRFQHLLLKACLEKYCLLDKKNISASSAQYVSVGPTLGNAKLDLARLDLNVALTYLSSSFSIRKLSNTIVNDEITVECPASKSDSNRLLILAALSPDATTIHNILHAEDTYVMINGLRLLGWSCNWSSDTKSIAISRREAVFPRSAILSLGNAGTASRFLTTLVAAGVGSAAKESESVVVLDGIPRLRRRPLSDLLECLRLGGAVIQSSNGYFPTKTKCGSFTGGKLVLDGSVSSQFVSSILLTAPICKEPVELTLKLGAFSLQYVEMTLKRMADFGVIVQVTGDNLTVPMTYKIPNSGYCKLTEIHVEADASSASYLLAHAALNSGTTVNVPNLGSRNSQGDANFIYLLEEMGCKVNVTPESTKITGVDRLKAIGTVDMASMTDTFITLAVLAAVANGKTKITNIANQQVKECDRISAVATELKKLGVQVRELRDGLEIIGQETLNLALISCYNDHRIAMSFALLGSKVRDGVVIEDKCCVAKTFPSFWHVLSHNLNMCVQPFIINEILLPKPYVLPKKNCTFLLVGMRASGKTIMGKKLAQALNIAFVDLDDVFVQKLGAINVFVEKHGIKGFRKQELMIFKEVTSTAQNCVIATGGCIVESTEALDLMKEWKTRKNCPIVIHLHRSVQVLKNSLQRLGDRVDLQETVEETYSRCLPLFQGAACFEVPFGNFPLSESLAMFTLKNICDRQIYKPVELTLCDSSFVSLPYFVEDSNVLQTIGKSTNAIEIRADLISESKWSSQIELLFSACMCEFIWTVRSVKQKGTFLSDLWADYEEAVKTGIYFGCHYIDIEVLAWPTENINGLIEYAKLKGTKVIASEHMYSLDYQCVASFHQAYNGINSKFPDVDVVKLVGFAEDQSSLDSMLTFQKQISSTRKPVIAISAGDKGALSRIFCNTLTPCSHKAFNEVTAQGQVDAEHWASTRLSLNISEKKRIILVGGPSIAFSPSPAMHNEAFTKMKLNYQYGLCTVHRFNGINDDSVFGANVTIPHKQTAVQFCSVIDEHVQAIGAVNTMVRLRNGSWLGMNTDWVAVITVLQRQFVHEPPKRGLVIGAGGMAAAACYALSRFGVSDLKIYNRSQERGELLAQKFDASYVDKIEINQHCVVVSCVPAEAQRSLSISGLKNIQFFIESVCNPRITPLMEKVTCPVVPGKKIFHLQSAASFYAWTGRKPSF